MVEVGDLFVIERSTVPERIGAVIRVVGTPYVNGIQFEFVIHLTRPSMVGRHGEIELNKLRPYIESNKAAKRLLKPK